MPEASSDKIVLDQMLWHVSFDTHFEKVVLSLCILPNEADQYYCRISDSFFPKHMLRNFFPDRITVWYHKEPFKSTELLLDSQPSPPPGVMCYDINNTLDHKEFILPPFRTGKKTLYLTKDIEHVLMDFIDKHDKSGNWKATRLLNRYFQTRRYRIRTVPEIIP